MNRLYTHFPNEILLMIYKFADIPTRLNMNKALKWSYRVANPFMNLQLPMYPLHNNLFRKSR